MSAFASGGRRQDQPASAGERYYSAARDKGYGEFFEPMITSRLVVGGSGSGKSTAVIKDIMEVVENTRDPHAIVLMDGHGSTAKALMLQLINRGHAHRVLYDKLSEFDRILAGFNLEQSTDPNPFRRESENTKRIMALMNLIWRASQRAEDIFTMPALSEQVDLALRLMMFQQTPVPLSYLPFALRFTHPLCQQLVANCTDEEVVERWVELQRLAKRNSDNLLEQKSGPLKRLIRTTFGLPQFRERCDGHFNIGQALLDKKIIILDGSDDGTVSRQAVTAVFGAMNLQISQFLSKNFTQTGKPCPVLVVLEEVAAYNLIGPFVEIPMLLEDRKKGYAGWLLSQHCRFLDPEVIQAVLSCTPRHDWFNPMDATLAKEAGEDIAYGRLNPHRIKHVHEGEERLVVVDVVATKRKGTSKGPSGTTETETDIAQPIYDRQRDKREELMSYSEQLMDAARQLMGMPVGYRMVRTRTHTSTEPEYVEMLPEPWPAEQYPWRDPEGKIHTLAEKKLRDAIAKSQERPEFKTPVFLDPTCTLPGTTTSTQKSEITPDGTSSTFIPLPQPNLSKQESTRPKRRRGKGLNGGKRED